MPGCYDHNNAFLVKNRKGRTAQLDIYASDTDNNKYVTIQYSHSYEHKYIVRYWEYKKEVLHEKFRYRKRAWLK